MTSWFRSWHGAPTDNKWRETVDFRGEQAYNDCDENAYQATSKRGFCLPQNNCIQLRTGTKPGAFEVSHKRCEPRLTTRLVGTQTHRALCIGEADMHFDSPIEKQFWDAWQEAEALGNGLDLEYQYHVPGTRYRLDFANLEEQVAIELDGYEYHSDRVQFTKDRQRQRELERLGWRFIRFSGTEVYMDAGKCYREACEVVANAWCKRVFAEG